VNSCTDFMLATDVADAGDLWFVQEGVLEAGRGKVRKERGPLWSHRCQLTYQDQKSDCCRSCARSFSLGLSAVVGRKNC
jgi:hypothetical protein